MASKPVSQKSVVTQLKLVFLVLYSVIVQCTYYHFSINPTSLLPSMLQG